jgi:hypothetical protein
MEKDFEKKDFENFDSFLIFLCFLFNLLSVFSIWTQVWIIQTIILNSNAKCCTVTCMDIFIFKSFICLIKVWLGPLCKYKLRSCKNLKSISSGDISQIQHYRSNSNLFATQNQKFGMFPFFRCMICKRTNQPGAFPSPTLLGCYTRAVGTPQGPHGHPRTCPPQPRAQDPRTLPWELDSCIRDSRPWGWVGGTRHATGGAMFNGYNRARLQT